MHADDGIADAIHGHAVGRAGRNGQRRAENEHAAVVHLHQRAVAVALGIIVNPALAVVWDAGDDRRVVGTGLLLSRDDTGLRYVRVGQRISQEISEFAVEYGRNEPVPKTKSPQRPAGRYEDQIETGCRLMLNQILARLYEGCSTVA